MHSCNLKTKLDRNNAIITFNDWLKSSTNFNHCRVCLAKWEAFAWRIFVSVSSFFWFTYAWATLERQKRWRTWWTNSKNWKSQSLKLKEYSVNGNHMQKYQAKNWSGGSTQEESTDMRWNQCDGSWMQSINWSHITQAVHRHLEWYSKSWLRM